MSETQIVLGAAFIEPGDVDEQQQLARPRPPLQTRELA